MSHPATAIQGAIANLAETPDDLLTWGVLHDLLEAQEAPPAAVPVPTEADMQVDLADALEVSCRRLGPSSDLLGNDGGASEELLAAACRRALHAEAIINHPREMLFADGRQPTTNERHLFNLLSWRQKEAEDAKADERETRDDLKECATQLE